MLWGRRCISEAWLLGLFLCILCLGRVPLLKVAWGQHLHPTLGPHQGLASQGITWELF